MGSVYSFLISLRNFSNNKKNNNINHTLCNHENEHHYEFKYENDFDNQSWSSLDLDKYIEDLDFEEFPVEIHLEEENTFFKK